MTSSMGETQPRSWHPSLSERHPSAASASRRPRTSPITTGAPPADRRTTDHASLITRHSSLITHHDRSAPADRRTDHVARPRHRRSGSDSALGVASGGVGCAHGGRSTGHARTNSGSWPSRGEWARTRVWVWERVRVRVASSGSWLSWELSVRVRKELRVRVRVA